MTSFKTSSRSSEVLIVLVMSSSIRSLSMVDKPATPDAEVPEDQRRFMLPRGRDGEPVAGFIARIKASAASMRS